MITFSEAIVQIKKDLGWSDDEVLAFFRVKTPEEAQGLADILFMPVTLSYEVTERSEMRSPIVSMTASDLWGDALDRELQREYGRSNGTSIQYEALERQRLCHILQHFAESQPYPWMPPGTRVNPPSREPAPLPTFQQP